MKYNDFISMLHELEFLDHVSHTYEKPERSQFWLSMMMKYFYSSSKREQSIYNFCLFRLCQSY